MYPMHSHIGNKDKSQCTLSWHNSMFKTCMWHTGKATHSTCRNVNHRIHEWIRRRGEIISIADQRRFLHHHKSWIIPTIISFYTTPAGAISPLHVIMHSGVYQHRPTHVDHTDTINTFTTNRESWQKCGSWPQCYIFIHNFTANACNVVMTWMEPSCVSL